MDVLTQKFIFPWLIVSSFIGNTFAKPQLNQNLNRKSNIAKRQDVLRLSSIIVGLRTDIVDSGNPQQKNTLNTLNENAFGQDGSTAPESCELSTMAACLAPLLSLDVYSANESGGQILVNRYCGLMQEFNNCSRGTPSGCQSMVPYDAFLTDAVCGVYNRTTTCNVAAVLRCSLPVTMHVVKRAYGIPTLSDDCGVMDTFMACTIPYVAECIPDRDFIDKVTRMVSFINTENCGPTTTAPAPCPRADISNGEALLWPENPISGSSTETIDECVAAVCHPPTYGTAAEAAVSQPLSDHGFGCTSYDKGTVAAVLESPGSTFHQCICEGYTCPPGTTMCSTSKTCIINEHVCNGQSDCLDDSDEANCDELVIKTEGGGSGIVMMKYRSLSTLVCDDGTNFSDRVADVICKEMGFRTGERSDSGKRVRDTQAWLTLRCDDSATQMSDCEQEWLVSRFACASMAPGAVICYT